jgi:hypothetical protein
LIQGVFEAQAGAQFITPERMSAGGAGLDPTEVKDGGAEFDLIPPEVAQFRRRIERRSRPTALATSDE